MFDTSLCIPTTEHAEGVLCFEFMQMELLIWYVGITLTLIMTNMPPLPYDHPPWMGHQMGNKYLVKLIPFKQIFNIQPLTQTLVSA